MLVGRQLGVFVVQELFSALKARSKKQFSTGC
jgi:hypothetical protein